MSDTRGSQRRERQQQHQQQRGGSRRGGGGGSGGRILREVREAPSFGVTGARLTRAEAMDVAQETLQILQDGFYQYDRNTRVDLSEHLDACQKGTVVVRDPRNSRRFAFSRTRDADFATSAGRESSPLGFALAILDKQRALAEEQPEAVAPHRTRRGKDGPSADSNNDQDNENATKPVSATTTKATTPSQEEDSKSLLKESPPIEGGEDSSTTTKDGDDLAPVAVSELTAMKIEVVLQTTLKGAHDLADEGYNVCALNFASAKNPGGGFLKGSTAQEETLARTTGLFHAIGGKAARELYDINRADNNNCLYAHALAYSPSVPIFRNDDCALLPPDEIVTAAMLTCPAPNAKNAAPRTSVRQVQETLLERVCRVVSEMERRSHDAVVLGSYGCGVFGNSVTDVARTFVVALAGRKFRRVRFSVISSTDAKIFEKAFGLDQSE